MARGVYSGFSVIRSLSLPSLSSDVLLLHEGDPAIVSASLVLENSLLSTGVENGLTLPSRKHTPS